MNSNIVLIGMMGCGKTTVGEIISEIGGLSFVDTDTLIESRVQMTVPQIFEKHGEPYFRALETEAAKQAGSHTNAVIATGGGMILSADNMKHLRGFVVYLRCEAWQLYERVGDDPNRPLLSGTFNKNFLENMLATREPLYKLYSNFIINAGEHKADELAKIILKEHALDKQRLE